LGCPNIQPNVVCIYCIHFRKSLSKLFVQEGDSMPSKPKSLDVNKAPQLQSITQNAGSLILDADQAVVEAVH